MATRTQLINRRNRLIVEKSRLDRVIADIEEHGVQSFTVSTGDGQKSATNLNLQQLCARRDGVAARLAAVRRQLAGEAGFKVKHRMTVRS